MEAEFAPEEYKVVQKNGSDVITRSSVDAKQYRRYSAHLKRVRCANSGETSFQYDPETDSIVNDLETDPVVDADAGEPEEIGDTYKYAGEDPSNAKRKLRDPARYKYYIPY